ncbi:MAG: hypothetical protein RBG13Loki_2767 [Promethearchaeota archaeon CR_4]|nr:MAG: hypothetical protein RBG13Loki_2767 [Candidatus Lokiarchaeota archaeon CR_4]
MVEEETVKPEILADEPRKRKAGIIGLLLMLVGVGLIVLITLIRIFVPDILTSFEGFRLTLTAQSQMPAIYDFFTSMGDFICYGIVIVSLIVVLLYAGKGTRAKVASIAKYAGLILLTFMLAVGLMGFLLGGFAGLFGDGLSVWDILFRSHNLPAFKMLVASSLLAAPLCFNRKKTRILTILTLVGVCFYIYIVATASSYLIDYTFFDLAWGFFIGAFCAGFFYKYLLAIPAQERWDMDAYVLGPKKEAYKKVLLAKAILEQKPVKVVQKIETEEGIKEEVKQEIPQGKPEELLNEAIGLYSETEERATKHGKLYEREVAKCEVWKQRVTRLLEEQKLVAARQMPEAEYHKRWLYIF